MLHLNARSLNSKMDQLEFLLAKCEQNFHVQLFQRHGLIILPTRHSFIYMVTIFFAVPGAKNQVVASLFTF